MGTDRDKLRRAVAASLGAVLLGAAVFGLLSHFSEDRGLPDEEVVLGSSKVRWVEVASGLEQPTTLRFVPSRGTLAWVLEKTGRACIVDLGRAQEKRVGATVFSVKVRTESEMGLLGLAFHPKYRQNGLFYVNYNPEGGSKRTRIAEWYLPSDQIGTARATERRVLLEVEQPYGNHNAGDLAFGPDGYLYVGFGDGGAANDPHGNGQNLGTFLGAMLRIDVDHTPGYAVPQDNPFVGRTGAKPEIWAYGLRNPWRYGFTPDGRLIVADVGQNRFEEVDWVEKGDNLGWNIREAGHCFTPETGCSTSGLVDPIFEYPRELGASITGGVVVQGRALPKLAGRYLFADYESGNLWALDLPKQRGGAYAQTELLGRYPYRVTSFASAPDGNVYATAFAAGKIVELVGMEASK